MAEFRIEFSIQRAETEDDDFTEVGFGTSSAWGTVDQALYDIESAIQNREWETEPGQPEPEEVDQ